MDCDDDKIDVEPGFTVRFTNGATDTTLAEFRNGAKLNALATFNTDTLAGQLKQLTAMEEDTPSLYTLSRPHFELSVVDAATRLTIPSAAPCLVPRKGFPAEHTLVGPFEQLRQAVLTQPNGSLPVRLVLKLMLDTARIVGDTAARDDEVLTRLLTSKVRAVPAFSEPFKVLKNPTKSQTHQPPTG